MTIRDRTRLQAHAQAEVAPATRRPQPAREDAVEVGALHAVDLGRPASLGPAALRHLQRAAGNSAVASLMGDLDGIDPVPGDGRPLDPAFAARMAQAFGTDFSDVRVHSGPEAAASATAFEARAYTIGSDIVQGEGSSDDRTMAHELAHVVQQRNGPVSGTPVGSAHVARFSISDPSDDFEQMAESAADSAMGSIPGLGGGLPSIPGLPSLPSIPGLGGGLPSIPGLPSLP
ncbi:MAG: DUF4157 domain-containing protein, partial [Candidatus Limnocylindrales bacterium]